MTSDEDVRPSDLTAGVAAIENEAMRQAYNALIVLDMRARRLSLAWLSWSLLNGDE